MGFSVCRRNTLKSLWSLHPAMARINRINMKAVIVQLQLLKDHQPIHIKWLWQIVFLHSFQMVSSPSLLLEIKISLISCNWPKPASQCRSRRALRESNFPQRLHSAKAHLVFLMAKAGRICRTIDLRSNQSMRSFYGKTGHFPVDFNLQSIMPSCLRFKGRHRAENICQVYDDVLENYNNQNKVWFTVTDNVSNVIKAFTTSSC